MAKSKNRSRQGPRRRPWYQPSRASVVHAGKVILGVLAVPTAVVTAWFTCTNVYDRWQARRVMTAFESKAIPRTLQEKGVNEYQRIVDAIHGTAVDALKGKLQSIGTTACGDASDIYSTVPGTDNEAIAVNAVLEVLTDDDAPSWIRQVAHDNPNWYLWRGRLSARRMEYELWRKFARKAYDVAVNRPAYHEVGLQAAIDLAACELYSDGNSPASAEWLSRIGEPPQDETGCYWTSITGLRALYSNDIAAALMRAGDLEHECGKFPRYWAAEGAKLRGLVLTSKAAPAEALDSFGRALNEAHAWKAQDSDLKADVLDEASRASESLGDVPCALKEAQESFRIVQVLDKHRGIANSATRVAHLLSRLGNDAEATRLLDRAEDYYRRAGWKPGLDKVAEERRHSHDRWRRRPNPLRGMCLIPFHAEQRLVPEKKLVPQKSGTGATLTESTSLQEKQGDAIRLKDIFRICLPLPTIDRCVANRGFDLSIAQLGEDGWSFGFEFQLAADKPSLVQYGGRFAIQAQAGNGCWFTRGDTVLSGPYSDESAWLFELQNARGDTGLVHYGDEVRIFDGTGSRGLAVRGDRLIVGPASDAHIFRLSRAARR